MNHGFAKKLNADRGCAWQSQERWTKLTADLVSTLQLILPADFFPLTLHWTSGVQVSCLHSPCCWISPMDGCGSASPRLLPSNTYLFLTHRLCHEIRFYWQNAPAFVETHCTWCMDWKTTPAWQAGRDHERCCVIHAVLSFLQPCSARGNQKASQITWIKLFPNNTIKTKTSLSIPTSV